MCFRSLRLFYHRVASSVCNAAQLRATGEGGAGFNESRAPHLGQNCNQFNVKSWVHIRFLQYRLWSDGARSADRQVSPDTIIRSDPWLQQKICAPVVVAIECSHLGRTS